MKKEITIALLDGTHSNKMQVIHLNDIVDINFEKTIIFKNFTAGMYEIEEF